MAIERKVTFYPLRLNMLQTYGELYPVLKYLTNVYQGAPVSIY